MPAGSLQQLSRNLQGERGLVSVKASHGSDGTAVGQHRRLSFL